MIRLSPIRSGVIGNGCSESGMSVRFQEWACGLGNGAEVLGMMLRTQEYVGEGCRRSQS